MESWQSRNIEVECSPNLLSPVARFNMRREESDLSEFPSLEEGMLTLSEDGKEHPRDSCFPLLAIGDRSSPRLPLMASSLSPRVWNETLFQQNDLEFMPLRGIPDLSEVSDSYSRRSQTNEARFPSVSEGASDFCDSSLSVGPYQTVGISTTTSYDTSCKCPYFPHRQLCIYMNKKSTSSPDTCDELSRSYGTDSAETLTSPLSLRRWETSRMPETFPTRKGRSVLADDGVPFLDCNFSHSFHLPCLEKKLGFSSSSDSSFCENFHYRNLEEYEMSPALYCLKSDERELKELGDVCCHFLKRELCSKFMSHSLFPVSSQGPSMLNPVSSDVKSVKFSECDNKDETEQSGIIFLPESQQTVKPESEDAPKPDPKEGLDAKETGAFHEVVASIEPTASEANSVADQNIIDVDLDWKKDISSLSPQAEKSYSEKSSQSGYQSTPVTFSGQSFTLEVPPKSSLVSSKVQPCYALSNEESAHPDSISLVLLRPPSPDNQDVGSNSMERPLHPSEARGSLHPSEARGSLHPSEARGSLHPSEARGSLHPSEARGSLHPSEARGSLHPSEARGSLHPSEARGSLHPSEARGSLHPSEARGSLHPSEARGSLHPSEARGSLHPSEARGSLHPSEARGSLHPSEARGSLHPSEARGSLHPSEARGSLHPSEARGSLHPSEARGSLHPSEARGSLHPSEARGSLHPSEARGSLHPSEARGSLHPSDPRGSLHPSEARENLHPSDPRGSLHPSEARESLHPSEARGSLHPSEARGSLHPSEARESLHPSEARGSLHPSEARGSLHPSDPRGSLHPCDPRGSLHPSEARGSLHPSEARGSLHPSEARGSLHPSEARGSLHPSEARGSLHPSEARGSLHPSEARGSLHPSEARGSLHPSEARGNLHPCDPRGSLHPSEARGSLHPSEARGSLHPSEARGSLHPSEARGSLHPSEARGSLHPSEARGSLHPSEARGSLHPCDPRGSLHPSEARGSLHPSEARGSLHPSEARGSLHPSEARGSLHPCDTRGTSSHLPLVSSRAQPYSSTAHVNISLSYKSQSEALQKDESSLKSQTLSENGIICSGRVAEMLRDEKYNISDILEEEDPSLSHGELPGDSKLHSGFTDQFKDALSGSYIPSGTFPQPSAHKSTSTSDSNLVSTETLLTEVEPKEYRDDTSQTPPEKKVNYHHCCVDPYPCIPSVPCVPVTESQCIYPNTLRIFYKKPKTSSYVRSTFNSDISHVSRTIPVESQKHHDSPVPTETPQSPDSQEKTISLYESASPQEEEQKMSEIASEVSPKAELAEEKSLPTILPGTFYFQEDSRIISERIQRLIDRWDSRLLELSAHTLVEPTPGSGPMPPSVLHSRSSLKPRVIPTPLTKGGEIKKPMLSDIKEVSENESERGLHSLLVEAENMALKRFSNSTSVPLSAQHCKPDESKEATLIKDSSGLSQRPAWDGNLTSTVKEDSNIASSFTQKASVPASVQTSVPASVQASVQASVPASVPASVQASGKVSVKERESRARVALKETLKQYETARSVVRSELDRGSAFFGDRMSIPGMPFPRSISSNDSSDGRVSYMWDPVSDSFFGYLPNIPTCMYMGDIREREVISDSSDDGCSSDDSLAAHVRHLLKSDSPVNFTQILRNAEEEECRVRARAWNLKLNLATECGDFMTELDEADLRKVEEIKAGLFGCGRPMDLFQGFQCPLGKRTFSETLCDHLFIEAHEKGCLRTKTNEHFDSPSLGFRSNESPEINRGQSTASWSTQHASLIKSTVQTSQSKSWGFSRSGSHQPSSGPTPESLNVSKTTRRSFHEDIDAPPVGTAGSATVSSKEPFSVPSHKLSGCCSEVRKHSRCCSDTPLVQPDRVESPPSVQQRSLMQTPKSPSSVQQRSLMPEPQSTSSVQQRPLMPAPQSTSSVQQRPLMPAPQSTSSVQQRTLMSAPQSTSSVQQRTLMSAPQSTSSVQQRTLMSAPQSTSSVQQRTLMSAPQSTSSVQQRTLMSAPQSTSCVQQRPLMSALQSTSSVQQRPLILAPQSTSSVQQRPLMPTPQSTSSVQQRPLMPEPQSTSSIQQRSLMSAPQSTLSVQQRSLISAPQSTLSVQQRPHMSTPQSPVCVQQRPLMPEPQSTSSVQQRPLMSAPQSTLSVQQRPLMSAPQSTLSVPQRSFVSAPQSMLSVQQRPFMPELQSTLSVQQRPLMPEPQSIPSVQQRPLMPEPQSIPSVQQRPLMPEPQSTLSVQQRPLMSAPQSTLTVQQRPLMSAPQSTLSVQQRPLVPELQSTSSVQQRSLVPELQSTPSVQQRPLVPELQSTSSVQQRPLVPEPQSAPSVQQRPLIQVPQSTTSVQQRPLVQVPQSTPSVQQRSLVQVPQSTPSIQQRPLIQVSQSTPSVQQRPLLLAPQSTPAAQQRSSMQAPQNPPTVQQRSTMLAPQNPPTAQQRSSMQTPQNPPTAQHRVSIQVPQSSSTVQQRPLMQAPPQSPPAVQQRSSTQAPQSPPVVQQRSTMLAPQNPPVQQRPSMQASKSLPPPSSKTLVSPLRKDHTLPGNCNWVSIDLSATAKSFQEEGPPATSTFEPWCNSKESQPSDNWVHTRGLSPRSLEKHGNVVSESLSGLSPDEHGKHYQPRKAATDHKDPGHSSQLAAASQPERHSVGREGQLKQNVHSMNVANVEAKLNIMVCPNSPVPGIEFSPALSSSASSCSNKRAISCLRITLSPRACNNKLNGETFKRQSTTLETAPQETCKNGQSSTSFTRQTQVNVSDLDAYSPSKGAPNPGSRLESEDIRNADSPPLAKRSSDAVTQITTEGTEKTTFSSEIFINSQTHNVPNNPPHGPTAQTSLLPYKPSASAEMYYVPHSVEAPQYPVAKSETTMESTHSGSNDAIAPDFPPTAFGTRDENMPDDVNIKHKEGIYSKKTIPKSAWTEEKNPAQENVTESKNQLELENTTHSVFRSAQFYFHHPVHHHQDHDFFSCYEPWGRGTYLAHSRRDVFHYTDRDPCFCPSFEEEDNFSPLETEMDFTRIESYCLNVGSCEETGAGHMLEENLNLTGKGRSVKTPSGMSLSLAQTLQPSISLNELWNRFQERHKKHKPCDSSTSKDLSLVDRLDRLAKVLQKPMMLSLQASRPAQEDFRGEQESVQQQKRRMSQLKKKGGKESLSSQNSKWPLHCSFGLLGGGQMESNHPSQPELDSMSVTSSDSRPTTLPTDPVCESDTTAFTDGEAGPFGEVSSDMSVIDLAQIMQVLDQERMHDSPRRQQKLFSERQIEESRKVPKLKKSPPASLHFRRKDIQASQTDSVLSSDSVSTVSSACPSPVLRNKQTVRMINKGVQTGELEIVRNTRKHTQDFGVTFPTPNPNLTGTREDNCVNCSRRGSDVEDKKHLTIYFWTKKPRRSEPHSCEGVSWFIPAENLRCTSKKENQTSPLSGPGPSWFASLSPSKPWRQPLREKNLKIDSKLRSRLRALSPGDDKEALRRFVKTALQESLERCRPDFISRSGARVKRLKLIMEERKLQRLLQMERDELFNTTEQQKEAQDFACFLSKRGFVAMRNRTITRKEMVQRTKRIYEQLPEVKKKREEEQRKMTYTTYRYKAQLYKMKVTNRILGRKVPWD